MDSGKSTVILVFLTLGFLLIGEVSANPGKWEIANVATGQSFDFSTFGWYPKNRRSMIFGIRSCSETTLTLNGREGTAYIMMYFGYANNAYFLVIPSSDCDAAGSCSITKYSAGAYLDCNDFKFFWATWDPAGNFMIGTGYTMGQNVVTPLTLTGQGLLEEALFMTFIVNDANGGTMYLYVDDKPEFVNPAPDGSSETALQETSVTGTVLYTITATDPEGDPVTPVLQEQTDIFAFSGNDLTNIKPLDYETSCVIVVTLSIHDNANVVNTSLTIRLQNVYDEAPSVDAVTVTIPEELAVGSYIDGGFTVSDIEDGDQLTYTLSGADASYFDLSTDGRLKVAARIDFDPPTSITQLNQLTLTVTDLGGNTNSTTLTFTVTDTNDIKPMFSKSVYTASVKEGAGTVSLLQLTVTDDDTGVNGDYDVTMTGDDVTDPKFTLAPGTLQLSVDANKLDYESLATEGFIYRLSLVATDKATDFQPLTGTAVAIITILPDNEFTPVWTTAPTDQPVSETTSPGSTLGQYTATDDDLSKDGDVSYEMVDVRDDQGTQHLDIFHLDSGTGDFILASPLDYDTATGGAAYYDVTIKAVDAGGSPKSVETTFRISVGPENDNPPVFADSLYQNLVAENVGVNTAVLSVAATDADGDTLTYTIMGEGQGTFDYTTELITVATLDHERKECFSFQLKANDGVHETEAAVYINVTNVIDETPVLSVHSPLTLIEELPVNTPLGGVYDVSDIDNDDKLTYSLEGTESSYFGIDPSTGVISVAQRIDRDAGLTSITQVTLKVTDAGGNTASEPLSFTIVDINDNAPQFSSDVIHVDLTENIPADNFVNTLVVTDNDDGANADVIVSIIAGDDANPNEKFKIDALDLKTHTTLVDYETLGAAKFQYTLTLQAVDQPTSEAPKTAVAVVVVTVLPVNEFTPTWTTTPSDQSVSETTSPGTILATYAATDDDLGADGDVSYKLVTVYDNSGYDGSSKFHFDSGTGEFVLSAPLDYDTATGGVDYYDVSVMTFDGGTNSNSVTTTFRISVGAENDNAPVFDKSLYQSVVDEDVGISTVMVVATATDADGDVITYRVSVEGTGTFDHVTDLINTVVFDYEENRCYTFRLIASDGLHETEVAVNVNISNVFDESPVITVASPLTLLEELPVGTPIGGVYDVTDRDEGDTLTFTLEGTESSYFNIDSTTGVISVAQRIDRDTGLTSITQVTLKVTDAGGNTASEPLSFNIVDINDNAPQFSTDVVYVDLVENTASDQVVQTLTCTDADDGDNAVFNFAIKSGDVAPDRFKLQGNDIHTTGQAVNYEDPNVPSNMYSLTVTAIDTPTSGNPNTAIVTVIVTVLSENEFAPVFTNPTTTGTTLSETTEPGHIIDTFIANDDDNGEDGQVVYTVTAVTDPAGISSMTKFEIDELSGKLRVAEALDTDVSTGGVAYYDITVTGTDKGSTPKSGTKTFKVTLQNENDIAPVFVGFTSIIDVPENTNVADVIVTLTTQDDDGDTVTASIVDGDTSLFSVTGTDITLLQNLDYETSAGHIIVISITDGVHTVTNALVVRVTDVIDETPVLETFSPVYVTEELPVDTEVDGLFHVTDLDRGDSFTYTLTGSDTSYFNINSTSGQIKISQRIDLESLAGDNILDQLTLTVEDQAGLQATGSLRVEILDINDAYPTFSQSVYKVNISESSSTEVLIDLVCNDADSGTNGDITMQITDGDDPVSSKFQLSGSELSALGADLDYEALEATQYMFILTVSATDAPVNESPKTGVTLVVVSVLPVNEHTPVWDTSLAVSGGAFPDLTMLENVTVGSDLLTLLATDADHGTDGIVSYHISSVTTNTGVSSPELFSVDSTSGALRIARQLDRDITSGAMYYTLILIARDGGNPSKEISATLKIILENVNDNGPVFSTNDYVVTVPETTTAGIAIHMLTDASDLDGDAITYTVVGGASTVFGISGLDLKTLVPLDFETERCYSVIVEASDGLYKDSIVMTVLVEDVIDEKPVITAHNPIVIPEEVPVGTRISWAINVTDADKGDVLQYSIAGTDASYFSIDPDNGVLTTALELDREAKATLADLTMQVQDTGGFINEAVVSINLLDVNDVIPTFDSDVYVVYVTEGGGEVDLVNFVVTDQDAGDNANYDVTITSGNNGGEFRLDGLTLKGDTSKMDYETPTISNYTYVVTVQAVDKPTDGASLTGATVVIVHTMQSPHYDNRKFMVGPLNEFHPVWVSPIPVSDVFPSVTVTESATPLTTSLVTYSASDDDSGEHGQITYSIALETTAEGTDASGVFLLNPVDGTLWMTKVPDADVSTGGTSSYEILIMARDGDQRLIEATQTITITNTNDNVPVIQTSVYSTEVDESIATGTGIFSLVITDGDGDATSATITQSGDYFDFDGTSVTIKDTLDFETERCHTIVISASDGVHDVNVTLSVNVTDVNDNTPEVTLHNSVSIPEELPVGTIVGGVYDVIDKDEGDRLTFSLSGTDGQYIEVNTATGELTVKSRIDRDGITGVNSLGDLTLTVTDSAGHNAVESLSISVLDVNDNPPVCSQSVFVINVTENSADGVVAQLSCTDQDDGNNGLFAISITDGNDLGHISLSNLDVHAAGTSIDYEALDTSAPYIVSLTAADQPTTEAAKSADISLIIQVIPKNEHSPVWQTPSVDGAGNFPTQTLSEITAPGTVVVTVTATDNDAGTDGEVTYDILSAIDDNGMDRSSLFIIDQSLGVLHTSGELDHDQPVGIARVELIIRATDGGSVAKATTGTLIIDVTPENDNAPVFTNLPTEIDVTEDTATGTVILNLQAADIDGDAVDFEVSGTEAHLFQIIGSSLKLFQNVDHELKQCHVLVLVAKDGVHTTNASITVNVVNVVDEAPRITLSSPLMLPEELPVGVAVGGFYTVNDPDVGDNLTYTLTGTNAAYFYMNSTGEMSIAKRIDRDSPGDVTTIDGLTLTVTDTAGLTDGVTMKFIIVDINDNIPVCSVTTSQVNVTEGSGQDVVLSELTCTDADSGAHGAFTMALDTTSDPNNHFKLSGSQLKTDANPIDYESIADVEIRVLVVDNTGGVIQLTATSVINVEILPVNEHSPVFVSPTPDVNGDFSDTSLLENTTVGSVIATFSATDADHGEDGDVSYSVSSITTDSGSDAAGLFTIDSSTGELRVSGQLDADTDTGGVSSYTVNITAMDSGTSALSTQGAMRILVTGTNDNPPVWNTNLQEVEVYENASVGDEVFSLAATDVDGDTVTFTTSDTMFEIDGSKVKVKQQLDFEQERCHTLTISASDGMFGVNKTFTVHVLNSNDESPVITFSMAMSIPEELPLGTDVSRTYTVTDKDENDILTYALSGSGSVYLTIDSLSGALSIAKRIDRDGPSGITFIHDVTLAVTDQAGHQATSILDITVVDINDNPPVCIVTPSLLNVTENTVPDTFLSDINCSDLDTGNYGNVNLSIDAVSDLGDHFRLSGTVFLTGSNAADYESTAGVNYMLTVNILAVDNPTGDIRLTSTLALSVKILPANEHSPVFVSPSIDGNGDFSDISLLENTTVGSVVATVSASDTDHGKDGEVMYSISSVTTDSGTDGAGLFTIDSSTGELRLTGQLDADTDTGGVSSYTVNITAMDSGTSALSTQGAMRILVTGTNDNPPEWNINLQEVEVYENASVGDEVFSLAVADVDGDTVTFTTSDTMFEIDGSKVKVKQQLDFEQERCHTLTISASDGVYTVNETFTLHVLDSNDESPVFTVTMAMSVPEELGVGTGVARGYIVTDKDENDTLSYSLEGTDSSLLAINSSTGEITVKERMDFESLSNPASLDITLKVTDSVGHTATHPLNLAVTDVNDNAPVFSQAVNIVTVTENASGETLLLKLTCTDADAGDNGKFSFNISDGNGASLFRLDGDDLYIQSVDYEGAESRGFMYSLTIIAVDHAVKPKTAATVVVVEIQPVNEFDPAWTNPVVDGSGRFPDLTLSESDLPGLKVITVTATDQDVGEDGHVVYSISAIVSDGGLNADNMFSISSVTGVISTSSQLDFDQSTGGAKYYDVTVTASDSGNQSRSITAVQRIELSNYNDIPPVFTKTLFKADVACNSVVGQKLMTLSADDADGPSTEYGIESGSNAYVSVASSGEVSLQSSPAGSSVTDLAQSISIVATDKGTPELKVLGRLLVLFENCGNVTSCENVTTSAPPTTTTTTTTTTAQKTTQEPISTNCTTQVPCVCKTTPFEDVIEAWAMRIMVMVLAAALLGAAILYFRPRGPPNPRLPRKVSPKLNTLERGLSDDRPQRGQFDDLEHHFLHK